MKEITAGHSVTFYRKIIIIDVRENVHGEMWDIGFTTRGMPSEVIPWLATMHVACKDGSVVS